MQRVSVPPGGSGYGMFQALSSRSPDPEANLGTPQKGPGFPVAFEWVKKCKTKYETGSLTGQARTDMGQFYPDRLKVLAQPSVNRIEVWDPGTANHHPGGPCTGERVGYPSDGCGAGWFSLDPLCNGC